MLPSRAVLVTLVVLLLSEGVSGRVLQRSGSRPAASVSTESRTSDDNSDADSSATDAFEDHHVFFSGLVKRKEPLETLMDKVLFRNRYLSALDKVGELMGITLVDRVHIMDTINERGHVRVPTRIDLEHPYEAGVMYSVMKHNTELLQGSFVDEIGLVRFEDFRVSNALKASLRG